MTPSEPLPAGGPTDATFRELVAHTPAAVTVVLDGTVVYANSAADHLVGANPGGLVGRPAIDFVHADKAGELQRQLRRNESAGDGWGSFETLLRHNEGPPVPVMSLAHPIMWEGHAAVSLITCDLTARAIREAVLTHAATHDPLTGLANRALLVDRLELAMARIGRSCSALLVVLLDLDDFKSINDTHGHSAGDQILKDVAARLRGALRASDTVARLAGDEFVICADLDEPEVGAALLRNRISKALAGPYEWAGTSISLTAGIGTVILTERLDPLQVIADADQRMYLHKRRRHRTGPPAE